MQARGAWLLAGVAVATLGVRVPLEVDLGFALDLSIGIFGGLVAALTFALALTIQQEQAWPSAWSVVGDSGVLSWLVISVAGLGLAVAGNVSSAQVDSSLLTASLWLSLLSLLVGLAKVNAILNAAGGPGRRRARVRMLRRDLAASTSVAARTGRRPRARGDSLDDFVVSFRRAVEAEDLPGIRSHTDELVEASATRGALERATAVATHLRMAGILGAELVRGQAPLASSASLQDLLDGAVECAGRVLSAGRGERVADVLAERRAAVAMGETARLEAFMSKAIWQK